MPRPRREMTPDEEYSRKLSYILRHGATKEKLPIREDGYLSVGVLLNRAGIKGKWNLEDTKRVVRDNDKQRYKLIFEPTEKQPKEPTDPNDCTGYWIRANQGHTINTKVEMKALKTPEDFPTLEIFHATSKQVLPIVLKEGLSKMKRQHIHLATDLVTEGGSVAGKRLNREVFIYINVPKALEAGTEFFLSENGVVLTEGKDGKISREFFSKILDKNNQPVDLEALA
ncbi:YALIA101S01e28524g1_1 [Yarrowia lipolytica]|nr:Putative tRNA 2'-phosphotransferase [Yarrowia lipolytica]SEI31646.1 YALIA101S01e28524g1_1 [Yarrowia lipolytica]VBB84923.1 tRNA splicing 2 phosphotransferase 1, putative [Yarrowia lipolytica]